MSIQTTVPELPPSNRQKIEFFTGMMVDPNTDPSQYLIKASIIFQDGIWTAQIAQAAAPGYDSQLDPIMAVSPNDIIQIIFEQFVGNTWTVSVFDESQNDSSISFNSLLPAL